MAVTLSSELFLWVVMVRVRVREKFRHYLLIS